MRRTDLMDTKEWAHRKLLEQLRKMTPAERFRLAIDRSEFGRMIHRTAQDRVAETRKEYR